MDSEPSPLSNSLCIMHWENYRSQTLPTDSTDEPFNLCIILSLDVLQSPIFAHIAPERSLLMDTTSRAKIIETYKDLMREVFFRIEYINTIIGGKSGIPHV